MTEERALTWIVPLAMPLFGMGLLGGWLMWRDAGLAVTSGAAVAASVTVLAWWVCDLLPSTAGQALSRCSTLCSRDRLPARPTPRQLRLQYAAAVALPRPARERRSGDRNLGRVHLAVAFAEGEDGYGRGGWRELQEWLGR